MPGPRSPYSMYPQIQQPQGSNVPAAGTGLGQTQPTDVAEGEEPLDLNGLDPQVIAALMESGALDKQQGLALMKQKAVLAQQSSKAPFEYTQGMGSGWGNAGVGIGNALSALAGNIKMKKLDEEQAALSGKATEARKSFADLIFGRKKKPTSPFDPDTGEQIGNIE